MPLTFVPNPMATASSLMNIAQIAGGIGNLMRPAAGAQPTAGGVAAGLAMPQPVQPAPIPAYQAPPPPQPIQPQVQARPFNPQPEAVPFNPQPVQTLNPLAQQAVNGPLLSAMLGSQNWGGQMPVNPLIDPQTSLAMSQGARQGAYAPVDAYNSMANLQMDNAKVQQQATQFERGYAMDQAQLQEAQRRQRLEEWQRDMPDSQRMLMEAAERYNAAKYANDLAVSRDDRNFQQTLARDKAQFDNQVALNKQAALFEAMTKGLSRSGGGQADPSLLKSSEFMAIQNAAEKDPNVTAASNKYFKHISENTDPLTWFNKWAESYSFVLPTVRTKAGPGSPEGGNWKGDVGKASSPDTMLSDAEARQFIKENPLAARAFAGNNGRIMLTVKDAFKFHTAFLEQQYKDSVGNFMGQAFAKRIGAIPLDVSEDVDSQLQAMKPVTGSTVVYDMQPFTVLGLGADGKYKLEPVSQTIERQKAQQAAQLFQFLGQ